MLDNYGFTTTLQKDEYDNIILDFPTELVELLGWKEGDSISIGSHAGRIIFQRVSPDEEN